MRGLPRSVLNTLHLSLRPVRYQRGQVVCREGEASEKIFIVAKGEFEVSKRIDTSKSNYNPETKTKVVREALPRRKLEEQQSRALGTKDRKGIESTKIEYQ